MNDEKNKNKLKVFAKLAKLGNKYTLLKTTGIVGLVAVVGTSMTIANESRKVKKIPIEDYMSHSSIVYQDENTKPAIKEQEKEENTIKIEELIESSNESKVDKPNGKNEKVNLKDPQISSKENVSKEDQKESDTERPEGPKKDQNSNKPLPSGPSTDNNQEHKHNYIWTSFDETKEKGTCQGCNDEQYRDHSLSDWKYKENNQDVASCKTCDYEQTREHVHQDAPEDITYTSTSNNNGTHKLNATYLCGDCNEMVTIDKEEACNYTNRTYEIFSTYNSNNQHHVVDTCDTCGYQKKELGDCVKTGDMQYIKINSTIYEYYNCELCNGYVDRMYHTEHQFNEWEVTDTTHISYCGCIEGRIKGDHVFDIVTSEDGTNMVATCNVCGYSKTVPNHEHAKDNMDEIELVLSPYYYELVDTGLIANPNPSSYDYCRRYDLICKTCGIKYSIHYDHIFEDGECRSAYCGHVKDPNYQVETTDLDEEKVLKLTR